MFGDLTTGLVLAQVSERRLRRICGDEPGLFCRETLDRTGDGTWAWLADIVLGKGLTILGILLVAYVANWILRRLAIHLLRRIGRRGTQGGPLKGLRRLTPEAMTETREMSLRSEQRAEAVGSILKSIVTVLVWAVALFMVLGEVGVDLAPLLAGAGIVGVAVGFGAQSLVKDFLTGIFILMEDQYGVGDTIVVDQQTTGTVEAVGLRSTRLRGVDGTVWHIPNGSIVVVGNQSQHWSRALLDVQVDMTSDVQKAKDTILRVAQRVREQDPHVLEEPELWGVQAIGPNGMTIRLVVKTTPSEQYRISRVLNERLKAALDEAGISPPIPQHTVVHRGTVAGEATGASAQADGAAVAAASTTAAPTAGAAGAGGAGAA